MSTRRNKPARRTVRRGCRPVRDDRRRCSRRGERPGERGHHAIFSGGVLSVTGDTDN